MVITDIQKAINVLNHFITINTSQAIECLRAEKFRDSDYHKNKADILCQARAILEIETR